MPSDTEQLRQSLLPNPIVKKAFAIATEHHANTQRKHKEEPYINHPLRVALLMQSVMNDPIVIAAALLHDVIEDTNLTPESIQREFGKDIYLLVDALTEDDKSMPWEQRKQVALEKLKKADQTALTMKLADQIDNILSLVAWASKHPSKSPWTIFNGSKDKKVFYWHKYYEEIKKLYPTCPLLKRYQQVLVQLDELAEKTK